MRLSRMLPLHRFLFKDDVTAIRAIEEIGAQFVPDLSMTVLHELGAFRRYFGVFKNVLELDDVVDRSIVDRVRPCVEEAMNEEVLRVLERKERSFTPVNKKLVLSLLDPLHALGLHLPWAYRHMNYDLAEVVNAAKRKKRGSFLAYYNQVVGFYPSRKGHGRGLVDPRRVYSLMVDGSPKGTWEQMIFDDLLDVDVALIIEATTLATSASKQSDLVTPMRSRLQGAPNDRSSKKAVRR